MSPDPKTVSRQTRAVKQLRALRGVAGYTLMDPCDACGGNTPSIEDGKAVECSWCENRGWRWVSGWLPR